VLGSLGHRGSNHVPIKGKTKKEEGAWTSCKTIYVHSMLSCSCSECSRCLLFDPNSNKWYQSRGWTTMETRAMAGTLVEHSRTPKRWRERSPLRPRRCSPPRWAERCRRSERRRSEVIVERIVERAVLAGNFPVLTKTKYYDWAALMPVMLQARGLWTAVTEGTPDSTEDRMVLEVILKAVPTEMMGSIASRVSAKVVWESITLRNIGVTRVRRPRQAPSRANLICSRSMTMSRWMTSAHALARS
jgi:hypothetical protein